MLPVMAAMVWPTAAVPLVSWAILMLALPSQGSATQIVLMRGGGDGGQSGAYDSSEAKIRILKMLSKSVIEDQKKQKKLQTTEPINKRTRVRGVRRPVPHSFRSYDYEQLESNQHFVEAPAPSSRNAAPRAREPVHRPHDPVYRPRETVFRPRDNRRQRVPSLASSFVESMSAPISGPRDIVRVQVPERPTFRSFMNRFRGLVLTGLGSMVPTFSP